MRGEMPASPQVETIFNREVLEEKIKRFQQDGKDKMQVIADFDRTLTKAEPAALLSLIEKSGLLGADYSREADELFKEYYAYELDQEWTEERSKKMREWQDKHTALFIKYGLTKEILDQITESSPIQFRAGTDEMIKKLEAANVPLVIVSGAPRYLIESHLKKAGLWHPNIHIIANDYEFDEHGKFTGICEPVVHVANKDEILNDGYHRYQEIESRTNVLILGDNPDDVNMIGRHLWSNIISVGFLNPSSKKNRNCYTKVFDAVITNDGSMKLPNGIIDQVIGQNKTPQ